MDDFVPSYKNEEERQEIRKQEDKKNKIRTIIISTIIVLAIIGALVVSYILANINYNRYKKYEEKMNIYGFSQVYDNQRANTKDKVTKSEAVKMVLSCLYNVPDIEGIAMQTDKTYSNAIWVEYAKKQGIVGMDEVTESNADDKVKYQEVLVWFYNIKSKILNMEPDTENKENVKDINAYNGDQQLAIYDLINSGVIVENTKNINGNQKLYKGKLNELIVNFADKYNTITVGNARININEDKIPDNYDIYPYTLASVEKSTYELALKNEGEDGFISPIELYRDNKQYYAQIKEYIEGYYGYLFNVDYNNISTEQMKRRLKKYAASEFDEKTLEEYVEYVKKNKIKLSGKVTVQMPCVYFDTQKYRVRTKIEFEVVSSDTKDNLLYYDLTGKKLTYQNEKYTLYADIIMTKNENNKSLFIEEGTIHSMLAKPSSIVVGG